MQILFISSIRWDFSWHRQQEMMAKMAERGAEVLFVQPCNKRRPFQSELEQVSKGLWLLTPKGLPYERCLYSVNAVNAFVSRNEILRSMRKIGFTRPIVWIDRVHGFDFHFFRQYYVVYDLIDEVLAFGRMKNKKLLIGLENSVLKQANLLLSSSRTLLFRKIDQSGRVGESLFIPNGVDVSRFRIQKNVNARKRIGFVGDISRRRLNYSLIRTAAALHQEWQFVFVGPGIEEDKAKLIDGLENIRCDAPVSGSEVPAVIADFDVGIIPYNHDTQNMDYVFPRKACEYLASGKPVVSTDMPEIRYLQPFIRIAETPEEFCKAIEDALQDNNLEERRKFAEQYDWNLLLEELFSKLERANAIHYEEANLL